MGTSLPRASFSVKLSTDDRRFLETVRVHRRLSALGDAVRLVVGAVRSTFGLPPYQAARVLRDAEARGLDLIGYVQELLARRYEALADEDASSASTNQAQRGLS